MITYVFHTDHGHDLRTIHEDTMHKVAEAAGVTYSAALALLRGDVDLADRRLDKARRVDRDRFLHRRGVMP